MSEYLNRTGAVIVVLTLIVSTIVDQPSFGRFFAALVGAIHGGVSRGSTPSAPGAWRRRSSSAAR
jgi:hypothetical protein